jgi:hypothetical protein
MPSLQNNKSTPPSIFGDDLHHSPAYRLLGLLNGLFIGSGLVLGTWGVAAAAQANLPVRSTYTSIILSAVLIIILTGTAGWLTARFGRSALTFLLWLASSILTVLIIGYETSHLRTWFTWLSDLRFWGLSIYPLAASPVATILAGGFFIILLLPFLALLQDYRLESIHDRLGENHSMTGAALLFLILPLPFVILAGFITNDILGSGSTPVAIELVHEAIQTGRTYEGDLFQLGLERGVNYSAIQGVREMMSANYTLSVTGYDPLNTTVFVNADFDNGAWIQCRVVNEQLSFCTDASLPYTRGFAGLINDQAIPEDCRGCLVRIDKTWESWLAARSSRFDGQPQIERLAQWGDYALMRAESPAEDYAIECWFRGLNIINLDRCVEVAVE